MNESNRLLKLNFNCQDESINLNGWNIEERKINSEDVVKAFTQLFKLKMYDDALLIMLLFSLSLDP